MIPPAPNAKCHIWHTRRVTEGVDVVAPGLRERTWQNVAVALVYSSVQPLSAKESGILNNATLTGYFTCTSYDRLPEVGDGLEVVAAYFPGTFVDKFAGSELRITEVAPIDHGCVRLMLQEVAR